MRSEIDLIDEALLELMERRLAMSLSIAELKERSDTDVLRLCPDREEQVIGRLFNRSRMMPAAAVNIIWRELMALNLQAQHATQIALFAGQQPVLVTDLARRRFGCAAPIVVTGSAEDALDRARDREAVAIIELNPLSGWWAELFHDEKLVIFDGLRDDGRVAAVAVGRVGRAALPDKVSFPIVSETLRRQRKARGENIRALAVCGHLRLCISEGPPAPSAETAR